MIIPTTGIVFLLGAFVYLYLSRRFWNCYKAENIEIAKFFSYAFFSIGLYNLIAAIPCLLLTENPLVWRIFVPIYVFFLVAGWLLLGYAVLAKIRFPKYSRILIIIFSLIIISSTLSTAALSPPRYFFVEPGSLDWEVKLELGIAVLLMGSLIFVPSAIIMFQEMKKSKDKRAKIRSFGFGLAFLWLIMEQFSDFFIATIFELHPIYSESIHLITLLILAITLIKTWGPPPPTWVKRVE